MREVNELILAFSNEPARVQNRLGDLRLSAEHRLDSFMGRIDHINTALLLTAVPLEPFYLDNIAYRPEVAPVVPTGWHQIRGKNQDESVVPRYPIAQTFWTARARRPIVRGARYWLSGQDIQLDEIFADGAVCLALGFATHRTDAQKHILHAGWFIETLAAALLTIDRIRRSANRPEAEYRLDVEIQGTYRTELEVDGLRSRGRLDRTAAFPPYSVGPREEFEMLFQEVMIDLLHAADIAEEFEWGSEFADAKGT